METKAAVVFEKSGEFSIEQLQISDPNDDEVLVRPGGAAKLKELSLPYFSRY